MKAKHSGDSIGRMQLNLTDLTGIGDCSGFPFYRLLLTTQHKLSQQPVMDLGTEGLYLIVYLCFSLHDSY